MNKTLLLSAIAFFSVVASALATVRIVDNNINSPAPYTDLQTAINACAVGDTLYVQASPNNYGSATIDRRITMIGAGYAVTGTQDDTKSVVSNLLVDSTTFTQPVSGTKIIGIQAGEIYSYNANVDNITINRVYLNYIQTSGSNWTITNSVINYLDMANNNSNYCLISNNIILSSITEDSHTLSGVVITNNLFLGATISNTQFAIISNNIFWNLPANPFSSVSNSTFSNNLTYGAIAPLTLPSSGNNGGSNINNINPLFVNLPLNYSSTTDSISSYNYTYQAGSSATNAGSDGTNIGLSGGAYPMTTWTGTPQLPQMQQLNITNAVINVNQSLNINFKARKGN